MLILIPQSLPQVQEDVPQPHQTSGGALLHLHFPYLQSSQVLPDHLLAGRSWDVWVSDGGDAPPPPLMVTAIYISVKDALLEPDENL